MPSQDPNAKSQNIELFLPDLTRIGSIYMGKSAGSVVAALRRVDGWIVTMTIAPDAPEVSSATTVTEPCDPPSPPSGLKPPPPT